ncbi:hypothetical protein B0T26DRAFT_244800 [Lasiosphaeria miniovina]|uniref:Uncharacterized protein n=1 Tax=Lasiosphaeria miniovina TaxID=1954250 RepID=A0AA40AVV9_9PEZI|nr:uncharacterized protein B0T26DRAFT_244800 [Lasiosphaeria miniovina]KAK0723002.1 hypothetical protein B0T26DRAFT_244800 [Lasiosphaeria miniovina]
MKYGYLPSSSFLIEGLPASFSNPSRFRFSRQRSEKKGTPSNSTQHPNRGPLSSTQPCFCPTRGDARLGWPVKWKMPCTTTAGGGRWLAGGARNMDRSCPRSWRGSCRVISNGHPPADRGTHPGVLFDHCSLEAGVDLSGESQSKKDKAAATRARCDIKSRRRHDHNRCGLGGLVFTGVPLQYFSPLCARNPRGYLAIARRDIMWLDFLQRMRLVHPFAQNLY